MKENIINLHNIIMSFSTYKLIAVMLTSMIVLT